MIESLTQTLKTILEGGNLPAPVRGAEVSFERPADAYAPSKTYIA